MAAITPELLKQKTKSLNRSSAVNPPTPPGMAAGITQDALKQTTLKRTPPPKPPLNEEKPQIQFPKLRQTGRLNSLVKENSESEDKAAEEEHISTIPEEPTPEKPAGTKPPVKPKPIIKKKPKKKPPPPIRRESLIHEDEGEASDPRDESGDESGSTSDQSERSVSSSRGSNILKSLPTLQRLGKPPPKKPITPDVRDEARRYIASELAKRPKRPEINNNSIAVEEPVEEFYDDVAAVKPPDETGEDFYDDVDSSMRTLTTNDNAEPEEFYDDVAVGQNVDEELYDDVAVTIPPPADIQENEEVQEDFYNDVEGAGLPVGGFPTSPSMDTSHEEELYNDVDPVAETPDEELYNDVEGGNENTGEEFYDDVDAVLKEIPVRPPKVFPTEPPKAENPIHEDDGEDEYELLPNEQPPDVPPSHPKPAGAPKKSKKDLEKEEKARKKKEEQERKLREQEQKKIAKLEDELMKKAKIRKDDDPIRVCVATCNAKSSGKYALQITESEVLFVIKEENGKCIVKNKANRIGYVDSKNLEDQVEEDSYECIDSLREKLDLNL